MANFNDGKHGTPPREIHVEGKKPVNWLAWLALAAGLLALVFALSRYGRDEVATVTPAIVAETVATQPTAVEVPFTSGLRSYLAGTEALSRTFVFEKLNFETAKSDVRTVDRPELVSITTPLKEHPMARIRIVGYADARGDAAKNATLGKTRADSVKTALVTVGISAARIETASGGEANPVATNATGSGQAKNRRTELVVLQR